ncbi:MAG: protein kinase [Myxococcales bacterium]|nr:protein kinase [Myxococcales bacterium]
MTLQPGSFVAGRYRVTRLIGQGSMGEVWEAVHTMTERPVALKVLLDGTSSLEARARILREARACGRIQHRNVIEVFDVGEVDDHRPFLVMPLLSGQTLEDHIDTRGPLSEEEALTVGLGVARALVAAHDLGIVHRDLKPANVFLHWEREASEPIVKVLDFGISKILSRDEASFTDAGRAVGSPAYMSPEQARGESDVDARTDIWSFGVLLFEALTAKLPFPGETPYAIVGHILHGEMPDFDTLCPNVRPGVRDLLRRCVMKDRGSRIPTARDLVGFLEAVMGRAEPPARWSTGATTSRVPLPASATATASALVTQKVEIPRPRSRARLLVIAGAALATVGGLAVAYVTTRRSGDPVHATATAPPSADPGVASQTEPVALPTSTSEVSAPASSEPPVSAPPSAEPSASPTVRPAPPRPRPTSKPSKKSALPDSPG